MIPNKIIIHHSLTKDSQTVSWGAIRKYHVETLGWDDIGYQFGIELINDHYEILIGRRPDLVGAHTIGQNDQSIGVCVVGNYDIDPLNVALEETIKKLLTWLILEYKIPSSEIYGHCQFANKTCPGRNLMDWLNTIK